MCKGNDTRNLVLCRNPYYDFFRAKYFSPIEIHRHVIEVHCDSLIRACISQNVAESSKVLERTSMLTNASVSPALQALM